MKPQLLIYLDGSSDATLDHITQVSSQISSPFLKIQSNNQIKTRGFRDCHILVFIVKAEIKLLNDRRMKHRTQLSAYKKEMKLAMR